MDVLEAFNVQSQLTIIKQNGKWQTRPQFYFINGIEGI